MRVLSHNEHLPIEGADLRVTDCSLSETRTTTDAHGDARLSIPPGEFKFDVSAVGFVRQHGRMVIAAVGNWQRTIDLDRAVNVLGRVIDAQTGSPVSGAIVDAIEGGLDDTTGVYWSYERTRREDEPRDHVLTGPDGNFSMDVADTNSPITLTIQAKGYTRAHRAWKLPRDGTPCPSTTIALELGASVYGTVRDANGIPQPAVIVVAHPSGVIESDSEVPLNSDVTATTDVNGRFEIGGLDLGGLYVVFAFDPHDATRRSEDIVDVYPKESAPRISLDINLSRPGKLTIEVVDTEYPTPDVEEFDVIRSQSSASVVWPTFTAVPGDELIVPPGSWRVHHTVDAKFPTIDVVVKVPEGGSAVARIVQPQTAVISGRVIDSAGRPVSGAEVWFSSPPYAESEIRQVAQIDGAFRIASIVKGLWRVRVHAADAPDLIRDVMAPTTDLRLELPRWPRIEIQLPPEAIGRNVRIHFDTPTFTNATGNVDGWNCDVGPVWDAIAAPSMTTDRWDIGPGRFRICVDDFLPVVRPVVIESGGVLIVDVKQLDRGVRVLGRVIDNFNSPVARATVAVEEPAAARGTVQTDADGRFVSPPLPPGPARFLISSAGFVKRSVTITAPTEAAVALPLFHGGQLHVLAVDDKGWPAVGQEVTIERADGEATASRLRTDHRGRCDVQLMPGEFRLSFRGLEIGEVNVLEDADTELRVTIPQR